MISAWSLVHACVATVASLTKEMTPIGQYTWYVAIFSKGFSITKLAYYAHVTVDSDKSCLSQQFAAHQARPTMMNPPPPVTMETKVKWRIFIGIARNPHCTIQASCTYLLYLVHTNFTHLYMVLSTRTWLCHDSWREQFTSHCVVIVIVSTSWAPDWAGVCRAANSHAFCVRDGIRAGWSTSRATSDRDSAMDRARPSATIKQKIKDRGSLGKWSGGAIIVCI